MADLTITPANVVSGSGARMAPEAVAGETITAGKAVYKSSTTHKWMLADSNSATAEARVPDGIALNGAALNQPLAVQASGPITIGATLTAGTDYWTSDTPGGLCPRADIGSGEYATLVGVATSTSVLNIDIQATGTAL